MVLIFTLLIFRSYSVQKKQQLVAWFSSKKRSNNVVIQLHFRMMNILLPAYSRNYAVLHGAGLITAADETENHELESLVLRERTVVWADQETLGQQLKSDRIGEESQETNQAGSAGLRSDLAPVLSFSHLLYHTSSPCSKFSSSLYFSFHLFWLFCIGYIQRMFRWLSRANYEYFHYK